MSNQVQFVKSSAGEFIAAAAIAKISPAADGVGFNLTLLGGLPPAHCTDLSGLGEIRPARKGAEALCAGELRSVYAWRICPATNQALPIWGLPYVRLPIDMSKIADAWRR